jgi:hypothetical protein
MVRMSVSGRRFMYGKSEPEGSSALWSTFNTYLSLLLVDKLLAKVETQA